MIEVKGKYNTAKVFTDNLEISAEGQLKAVCDMEIFSDSKIRIMPDVHAGKGCTIGTTMTIENFVVPNMVGVDIGCGMLTVKLKEKRIELPKLDSLIKKEIPSGKSVRATPHSGHELVDITELKCLEKIGDKRARESIGTLGGGNHFIEVDKEGDDLYLVIHTGSRNLGLRVAEFYQEKAFESLGGRNQSDIPYELAYLSGWDMENYLHDMEIMQRYAQVNRRIIKEIILKGMKLHEEGSFSTVHNYIDIENMVLRKGAVSSQRGEKLLIPMNMRDGSLICTGLGNSDWNCSAPHGAGRIMSRKEVADNFTLSQFKKSMDGIFTSCISRETLDEAPFVYKPMDEILKNIGDTVTVDKIIKPIYNFKASE